MSWTCYLVELRGCDFYQNDRVVLFNDLKPGAMWSDDGELTVKLPSGSEWNMDRGRLLNAAKKGRDFPQWTRTGEAPNVTAHPSINHVGQYHGWLKNGVLTDDCEGRTYKGEA